MNLLSAPASFSSDALWRWGRILLWGGLGLGLALVLLLAWRAPHLLVYVPVLLLSGMAAWWLFQHPMVNLSVVLAGYVLISGNQEGLQPEEILYGLYYLGYLAFWFGVRLLGLQQRTPLPFGGKALLIFLVYATGSAVLIFLFGHSLSDFRSDWLGFSLFAFYFPVREACLRHPRFVYVILALLIWIVLFAAIRNFLNYRQILLQATQGWQVAKGRVATNEMTLMFGAIGLSTFLLYARTLRQRVFLFFAFCLTFGGLILTQGRVAWIAFLIGCAIVFVFADRRRKGQLLLFASLASMVFLLGGFLFFPDYFALIFAGIARRFTSLSDAGTDISLLNRIAETQTLWEYIRLNPLLGYGFGTRFKFYDLIEQGTFYNLYAHNGYIFLWFKLGLVGLTVFMSWWLWSVRQSIRLFRSHAPYSERVLALVTSACFLSLLLHTSTSNPLSHGEAGLLMGILSGLVSGCWQRAHHPHAYPSSQA